MSGSDEQVSSMGHTRQEGFSDTDDYISIESGRIITASEIFFIKGIKIMLSTCCFVLSSLQYSRM